jgi:hypothetical protein
VGPSEGFSERSSALAGGPGVSGAGTAQFTHAWRARKADARGQADPADRGAEETRTPDFLLAKEALYQLSYGP